MIIDKANRFHYIPGAPSGVVAFRSSTEPGKEPTCEVCQQPIKHPSNYWCCGAFWLPRKKGRRHPDGLIYWHDECIGRGETEE